MVTRVPIYLGGTGESTQASAQAALGLHSSNSVAFTSVVVNSVNVLANDGATLLTARSNDWNTYSTLAANDGATLLTARGNDYTTYLAALSNDGATLLTARGNDGATLLTARGNDYTTYLAALSNDGATLLTARGNDYTTYLAALSNDYATYLNAQANDGATLLTARGNDWNTYSTLAANDGATLLTARGNDYTTYLAALSNDGATLLTARGNDYTTYLAALSNDFSSYTYLNSNISFSANLATFNTNVSFAKANILQQTLTDAATISWDTSLGQIATVTLGASRTMGAPTNLRVGTYILHVIQGGTGSYTITWNGVFKWTAAVAPTLSTVVGRRDVFSFISDGTNLYGAMIPDVR
jgi:hypothetical protein